MTKVSETISVTHEGQLTLAMRHKLVNVSVLQSTAQQLSALGFLILADTHSLIQRIAPLPEKWLSLSTVNAEQAEFLRTLKALGIAERVPGDVGRRAKLAGSEHLLGEIDYGPGFWLHVDLVMPYARWIASRQVPPRKTPLIAFLEKHLPSAATGKAAAPIPAQEVSEAFAGEISAKELADLRIVDRMMITDGVSAAERTEVLRARIDSMQGA